MSQKTRSEESRHETERNRKSPKREDVDSGCARAQITCKHTDETQASQNTGEPAEQNKNSEQNKQKQIQTETDCYKTDL